MPKSYAVTRTIGASRERVWSLLTDAEGYAAWNPAVVSLAGRVEQGQTIALVSTVDPKRTFRLRVAEARRPERLVWADGMPLGLFRGVRTFTLTAQGTEATAFSMQEVFSGPLAPLITKAIPDLTESFEQFADGLQRAAEAPLPAG